MQATLVYSDLREHKKHTKAKPKQTHKKLPHELFTYVRNYMVSYTIQHAAALTIFSPNLHIITTAQIWSTGGEVAISKKI